MKTFIFSFATICILMFQSAVASVVEKCEVSKQCEENSSNSVFYETDGHYWTVLVVATLLKKSEAKEIAFHAEYPDNVINEDGYCVRGRMTYLYPKAQRKVHALTGGNPERERAISMKMIKNAKTPRAIGTASHRLGDSFAHTNDKKGKMFPHLIGHLLKWQRPDKIRNNAPKYLEYVNKLVEGLGGPDATIDMTVFNYIAKAGFSSEENEAILKAEYNVLSNSPAFNITRDQVKIVENYLNERLAKADHSFIIHSNKDNKGRVTTTIILTSIKYVKLYKLEEVVE